MKSSYRRVTCADRCHIYASLQVKIPIPEIALKLGFHKSSIYREIQRNSGKSYEAVVAECSAKTRYEKCRKAYKLSGKMKKLVYRKLRRRWSPQEISGRLLEEQGAKISHECIYQHIRRDPERFKPYLRRFRKRGMGRIAQRRIGRNKHLLKITARPKIVEARRRFGDWERDVMLVHKRRAILVCVERKSRFVRLIKAPALKSELVNCLTKKLIGKALTLTNDRGPEFVKPLPGVPTYYCDPQAPFQRGTIENTIGLLRQYIKPTRELDSITTTELKRVERELNKRPRRCLNYKTPYEVFFNKTVALAS